MKEGILPGNNNKINVEADPKQFNNDASKAIQGTQQAIKDTGADVTKYNVNVSGDKVGSNVKLGNDTEIVSKDSTTKVNGDVAESKLISKKELRESRLDALKKNSKMYSVKDFMKNINK